MPKVFILLFAVCMVLWIYFLWCRRRFYKAYCQLRGPFGLPFIGLGLQMTKPENFLKYMEIKAEQYKTPFISWMGMKCFLYVNDPQTMETIFNSACCINKGDLYHFIASAIGDGLFTSSSPRWNKHRRLINPSFSRKVVHSFLPVFNREANELINKLSTLEGQPLDMYEVIKRSVLETACRTTMGKKMDFQKDGSTAIFESYNGLTEVCVKRMLSPWLYSDFVFKNSFLHKRQQKYINVLYEFVENLLRGHKKIDNTTKRLLESTVISTEANENSNTFSQREKEEYVEADEKRDSFQNEEANNKKSHVFIEQIRKHIDQGQLTWKDVRDEANVVVAATFETTSTALYFVCLCLAMHPEYQDKLIEELIAIFPTANDEAEMINNLKPKDVSTNQQCKQESDLLILNEITLQHLDRMTYAEMVINEAMRLFAPVPMVLRQASRDFKINDGTLIPKGTQIGIDIFNMQRSKEVWGPYARTFNPEHFAANRKRHPFAFIPFTKGLRMCIGYRYALILMKIILVKIFRNFRIHTDAKIDDLRIKGTISLKLSQYPLCTLQRISLT